MNIALDVAYVFLVAHNHHHTEAHSIFSMFMSMSWRSSIYVISVGSIYNFKLHFHYN